MVADTDVFGPDPLAAACRKAGDACARYRGRMTTLRRKADCAGMARHATGQFRGGAPTTSGSMSK